MVIGMPIAVNTILSKNVRNISHATIYTHVYRYKVEWFPNL